MNHRSLVVGINSFLGIEIANQLLLKSSVTGIYHQNKDKAYTLSEKVLLFAVENIDDLDNNYNTVYFISAYIPENLNQVDYFKLYKTNIELLRICISKFSKAKIILASTVSVYGSLTDNATEISASNSVNPYGLSKLMAEEILKNHHHYAILRISSLYGVGMKKNTILPNLIKQSLLNNCITLNGNGERRQNYVHAKDVAALFIKAAETKINGTYLATYPKSYSNIEVAKIIANEFINCRIIFTGEDNSLSATYNNSFTENNLNYRAAISLEAGIKDVISWIKKES